MALTTLFGNLEQGCIYAILALGLFIAFRILNLPDLTVDGSFVTGLAYSCVWTVAGHPLIGILMGTIGGLLAGVVTGIFHTKLKVHEILAGILTMTGLYSINLMIMRGSPSIAFVSGEKTMFSFIEGKIFAGGVDIGKLVVLIVVVVVLIVILDVFLKTQPGLSLRATGDNEAMVRSSSINTDVMKIFGFALCNMIVALSGAIYAQYNKSGNVGVGTGMLVLGLASIIIGETAVGKRGMLRHLIAVAVGAVIYRLILAIAFQLGLPASNLKLFAAIIVVGAISVPLIKPYIEKRRKRHAGN